MVGQDIIIFHWNNNKKKNNNLSLMAIIGVTLTGNKVGMKQKFTISIFQMRVIYLML